MQFYDPNELITEVQELFRNRGLNTESVDVKSAQIAAGRLIRALGATPAIDSVDAHIRNLASGPWPDADDRQAAAS